MNQTIKEQLAVVAPQLAEDSKQAMVTGTRDAFFDPKAYICEILTESALKSRLMQTAVWALDSQIVSAATSMYFEIRSENPEAKDMQQLIDAFTGTYSYEGYWGEGPARKMVRLLSMQQAWHDEAHRLAAADGYLTYQPKSIQDLVLNQQPMRLKEQTKKNLEAFAEFVAEDGNITKEEATKALIEQQRERALASAEFRRSLYPAVNCFVMEARKHMSDDVTFESLDTGTKLMIDNVLSGACTRALSDLAPRLDSAAYMMVMREALAARKVFTRVVDRLSRELERERSETGMTV